MLADADRLHHTVEQVLKAGRRAREARSVIARDAGRHGGARPRMRRPRRRRAITCRPAPSRSRRTTSASLMVRGDAEELRTVITNLLDNAVKYSGDDVRVTVSRGGAVAGHGLGARAGPRRRHPAQAAQADLQALLSRADARAEAGQGHGPRPLHRPRRSRARTAAASSHRAKARDAAPRSRWSCPALAS